MTYSSRRSSETVQILIGVTANQAKRTAMPG